MKLSEAYWYNAKMQADLALAREKLTEIQRMQDQVDHLVSGYAKEVMQQMSLSKPHERQDIEAMIDNMPQDGFHRTELRTALNEKFGRQTIWPRPAMT